MGLLGAHISIGGGLETCFQRGEELQCEAVQIFSRNQKQWKSAPISKEKCRIFQQRYRQSSVRQVIIHDSYLINLASPDREGLKKSREAFIDEINRSELLGVPYLVFHPGSHKGTGEGEGILRISESLNRILEKVTSKQVQLLLETTSGQGSHIGYQFEQLGTIISQVEKKDQLGVCFDTAHVFASGYDFRDLKSYQATLKQFDKTIGLEKLKVFHLNDSKSSLGSRLDRHEHIGKGFLGLEAFRLLINDIRFENHPMVLETPGGMESYKNNLNLLYSLKNGK
jgi:deoxyribonuclease-4